MLCLVHIKQASSRGSGDQQPAAGVGGGKASDAGGAGAAVTATGRHAGGRWSPGAPYVTQCC